MKNKPIMLIVDDIEANREMVRPIFEDEFSVITACDGKEAMGAIQNNHVAMILLDIIMPEMDGIEVLQWLSTSEYRYIPVIAVTAEKSYQLKALKNGAWDFIAKPTDNSIIQARVHNVLGRYKLEKERELTATLKFYDNLVNESSSAVYVNDLNTYELLHMNSTALKTIHKETVPYEGEKCYAFIFGRSSPCEFCKIDCLEKERFIERDFKHPFDHRIYCLRGKLTDWNGVPAHVEYIQDVTENRRILQENITLKLQAEEALNRYQTIVNTVPGAIVLYEIEHGKAITKYYSDGLCALSGFSREERDAYNRKDAMALVWDEDVPYVQKELQKAMAAQSDLNLTYRLKTKSGTPRFINLRATYLSNKSENPEFHAVFSDIDDLKRMEEAVNEQQLRYEVAIKGAGINIWEYDIQKDSLMIVSHSARIKQDCFIIENYVETTLKNDYVREDSLETFHTLYRRLKNGEKEVAADLWYKTNNESGFWCERVIYTSILDEHGTPIKAFGAGRDVTREKEAEIKFQEETSYREAMQYQKLAFIKIDLTKNQVLSGESKFPCVLDMIKDCTADEYFAKTLLCITGRQNQADFEKQFNRQSLLNKFSSGEFSVSFDFTTLFGSNRIFWINYSLHLMQNPDTKDIIAYIISTDITNEKVMQTVMETVAKTDYDFFVVVNGSTNSALDYAITYETHLFSEEQPFDARLEEVIRQYVCAEDIERVVSACKMDTIMAHIQNGEVYKLNFSMTEEAGEVRRKQLQFTLIDLERKAFLMTRIDVNNIYIEQQKVQQQLMGALEAANQASKVKTDFLSRMSHDMRTPMNGIIGLTRLSKYIPNLPEEMKKNLDAIDDSGKYLMSLINDTLDMNKIESNKITLHPEVVYVNDLVRNILTFVDPMVQEKQITMQFVPIDAELEYIRVDRMRVEQIFINILSNAIKFTPNGGKIRMEIECLKREHGIAYDRISVEDSGIGMSPDFLPKVFEPFAQESTAITTNYAGTGLGLSIVKNLVELMGGRIEIESELGKGTKVTAYLNFERIYDHQALSTLPEKENQAKLEGKRILLCEDHPLNAQIATKLLESKGMLVSDTKNGKEAVELFRSTDCGYYHAILMDIRMPVMGGLEACQKIRALERDDAKTIPIIAMTANAFDDDVQQSINAGMNAHIAKPVEPETLFDTLLDCMFRSLTLSTHNSEGGLTQ